MKVSTHQYFELKESGLLSESQLEQLEVIKSYSMKFNLTGTIEAYSLNKFAVTVEFQTSEDKDTFFEALPTRD